VQENMDEWSSFAANFAKAAKAKKALEGRKVFRRLAERFRGVLNLKLKT